MPPDWASPSHNNHEWLQAKARSRKHSPGLTPILVAETHLPKPLPAALQSKPRQEVGIRGARTQGQALLWWNKGSAASQRQWLLLVPYVLPKILFIYSVIHLKRRVTKGGRDSVIMRKWVCERREIFQTPSGVGGWAWAFLKPEGRTFPPRSCMWVPGAQVREPSNVLSKVHWQEAGLEVE